MRILLIHNKYKLPGGEDGVFNTEKELLRSNGHMVDEIIFDNSVIGGFWNKCINGLRLLYNPVSAKLIGRKIEAFKPDVIHVHNFVPLVSPSVFWVANKHKVPVVLTLHNFRLICPSAVLLHKNKIYEKSLSSIFPFDAVMKGVYRDSVLETFILATAIAFHHLIGTWKNKVDFYISLTSFAKEKFTNARMPLPASKVLVKPNCAQDFGVGDNTKRGKHFIVVGRIEELKGIRSILEASKKSNFKVSFIGDGPLRQEVIEHSRTNENVVYLGPQDKAAVMNHMKSAAGLIFASLCYEGLPLTIIEAFSTGTPVLASNHGAMKELVQNGVNGLVFEPGNPDDMVRAINELKTIDTEAMSQNARATYLRYFTPERNYNMLLTIYNKAIATKHASESNMAKYVVEAVH